LNDSDIMAYSSVNAGGDDGDDSVFSSGGAIMDALGGKDPSEEEENKQKLDTLKKSKKAKVSKKSAPKK